MIPSAIPSRFPRLQPTVSPAVRFGNDSAKEASAGANNDKALVPAGTPTLPSDSVIILVPSRPAELHPEPAVPVKEPELPKKTSKIRQLWNKWKNRPNKEPLSKKLRRYVIETLAFYGIFGAALWGSGVCTSKVERSQDNQYWFQVTHTFHKPGFLKNSPEVEKPASEESPEQPETKEKDKKPADLTVKAGK